MASGHYPRTHAQEPLPYAIGVNSGEEFLLSAIALQNLICSSRIFRPPLMQVLFNLNTLLA